MKKLFTLIVLFTVGQMCKAQSHLLSGQVMKAETGQHTVQVQRLPKMEGNMQFWVSAMAYWDEYGWFDVNSLTPTSTEATLTFNGDEVTFDGIIDLGYFELETKNEIIGHYDAEAKTITISTPEYEQGKGMDDFCVLGTMLYYGSPIYLAVFAGDFSTEPDMMGQYALETVNELVFDVSDDFMTLTPRTGYGCYGFTVSDNRTQGFLNFYKTATYNRRTDAPQLIASPENIVLSGPTVTVGAAVSTVIKLTNIGYNEAHFICTQSRDDAEVLYPSEYIQGGETENITVNLYPTAAGTYEHEFTFTTDNGSTAVVNLTAEVGEAPDFSAIVKKGDIAFSFNEDLPFALSNDVADCPVAVSTNDMESSGKSSLVANVRVPKGKVGVFSWKGMSECLHPNGGSYVYLDGAEIVNNVYEHQSEGFLRLPIDNVIVLGEGNHEITFTNIINMNAYLYGFCSDPFRTYVYDLSLELQDVEANSAMLLTPTIDFGRHYLDKLSAQDHAAVTLLNVGTEPLQVTAVSADGPFAGIVRAEAIPFSEKGEVMLTFESAEIGEYNGNVTISTTAGDFTVGCTASCERLPYDYTPIVTGGEFSFNTDFVYPFKQEADYAYSSTSYMDCSNGKLVSWLEADFVVPEGMEGTLSWTGVNSSEDWFNFMGNKSFNDGTRIKLDDTVVREFCGEDPASSTAFDPSELVFAPGHHKVRFEYEKILAAPKGEDLFRLSNLKLVLGTSGVPQVSTGSRVVRTEIFTTTGEQVGSMRKGVNIVRSIHADGSVTISKVVVR